MKIQVNPLAWTQNLCLGSIDYDEDDENGLPFPYILNFKWSLLYIRLTNKPVCFFHTFLNIDLELIETLGDWEYFSRNFRNFSDFDKIAQSGTNTPKSLSLFQSFDNYFCEISKYTKTRFFVPNQENSMLY